VVFALLRCFAWPTATALRGVGRVGAGGHDEARVVGLVDHPPLTLPGFRLVRRLFGQSDLFTYLGLLELGLRDQRSCQRFEAGIRDRADYVSEAGKQSKAAIGAIHHVDFGQSLADELDQSAQVELTWQTPSRWMLPVSPVPLSVVRTNSPMVSFPDLIGGVPTCA
jgi:hypothetical protein